MKLTVLLQSFCLIIAMLQMAVGQKGLAENFNAYRPSISPDGKGIIFSSSLTGNGDLYLINLHSNILFRLTSSSDFEGWPSYSPDGSKILFSKGANQTSCVHLILADKQFDSQKQLTRGDFFDAGSSFSNNGDNIIFCRASRLRKYSMGGDIWDNWDIYSINTNGDNLMRLTEQNFRQLDPPCFVHGEKIIFAAEARIPHSKKELYFLDLGPTNTLTRFDVKEKKPYITGAPNVSITKGRIVFLSNQVSRASLYDYELWTSTLDGQDVKQITSLHSFIQFPFFEPDGNRIYFLSDTNRDGGFDLMSCELDGTNLKRIYSSIR